MPTTPEQVRRGLQLVTAASIAEVEQVARAYQDPEEQASALFLAVPLIVSDYIDGSSALALDWYEELRDFATPSSVFVPSPVTLVREAEIGNAVAWATQPLRDLEAEALAEIDALTDEMLARLTPVVQKDVAAGFWDTMTENVKEDPEAVGWQRIAREGACPFCRMLADKGAVYRKESTATFAAHTTCHCVAAPKFANGDLGPEADVMQYLASSKRRTPAQRAALREYLKANYGA